MRIKKFTANNYADALEQVKNELGDEALIMNTRSIKPDSPLSSRKAATKVEITAAVEFKEPVVSNFEEELHLDEGCSGHQLYTRRRSPHLDTKLHHFL